MRFERFALPRELMRIEFVRLLEQLRMYLQIEK